ncbi:MAG: hypothetical protein M1533_02670 [Candidatus Thermoplasmatota archaeon]|jgi:hypothetical protein|nr:hypothetical protein [Candidatus Thermoplasmatota archaeon]MCL5793343.1 hypothetical protein [Candidatus Thermoplasmatota archaeon]
MVDYVTDDLINFSTDLHSRILSSERTGRIFYAIFLALLVFYGSVLILITDAPGGRFTYYFTAHAPGEYLLFTLSAAFATGALAYSLAGRRSGKFSQMNDLVLHASYGDLPRKDIYMALLELDSKALMQIRDDKAGNAILVGFLFFLLFVFIFPYGFVIALIVWFYLRQEALKEYNREFSRIEGLRSKIHDYKGIWYGN